MARGLTVTKSTQHPSMRLSKVASGYCYLIPAFLVLTLVVVWPLIEAVWMSLHEAYLLKGMDLGNFVGFDNYVTFIQDPRSRVFLLNTGIFVVGVVGGDLALGLVLALLLNRPMRFRMLWRALAIIPWAMPMTVSGLSWRWILNGQWGILNYLLQQIGVINQYVAWLSEDALVWPSLLVVAIWQTYPFAFVCLLAGLQGIPHELNEAAAIDGASRRQAFASITIPMLRPVMAATVLLLTIMQMREFATIWIMTSGGPGIATTTLSPLVYITSFRYFKMGYGAAIGIMLLAINAVFAFFYLRRMRFSVEGLKEA